jgi:hypothetical protein
MASTQMYSIDSPVRMLYGRYADRLQIRAWKIYQFPSLLNYTRLKRKDRIVDIVIIRVFPHWWSHSQILYFLSGFMAIE